MSSLKSAVLDSPNVELTMLDSLELLAPMASDDKSIFNNLQRNEGKKKLEGNEIATHL